MIDAAWVLGGGSIVDGDTGSSDYTTFVYETGVGKGATITPVGGDTSKKLFLPNAGDRVSSGAIQHYGEEAQLWPATQYNASQAYFFIFSAAAGELSGRIAPFTKLYAFPLRCVRS